MLLKTGGRRLRDIYDFRLIAAPISICQNERQTLSEAATMKIPSSNLDTNQYQKFGIGFLNEILERGFGKMTKKELEVSVFNQLHSIGYFDEPDNFQKISRKLRIPLSRVRTLTYEMGLLSNERNEEWFLKALGEALKRTRVKTDGSRIEFGIDDPLLRAEVEASLKQTGCFPDYSFNRSILRIDIGGLAALLDKVLDEGSKNIFLDGMSKYSDGSQSKNPDQAKTKLLRESLGIFVRAAAQKGGETLGEGLAQISLDFLTGGASTISRAIHATFD